MLTNPLPHNQNMNSRTHDPHSMLGGDKDPSEASTSHGCINMVRATKAMTRVKDYGSSQPDLGKEPPPTKIPLCIENTSDKPKSVPQNPKGVLKCSGHNPNA